MTEKSPNIENEKKDNEISLSSINQKLYDIFHNKNYLINNFILKYEKVNSDYIINYKEIRLFNVFLIYIIKTTKTRDILKYLGLNKEYYKKKNTHIILNESTRELYTKLRLCLPKFFNICIFNSLELSKLLNYNNKIFTKKIFELIQILYLNNLIDKTNLINIIRLKLITCLFKGDFNEYNEDFLKIKNKTILNIFSLEVIINFLLSFKNIDMSDKKVTEFMNVIEETMKNIDELILSNYNNIFLLSNSLLFYRLIELSQISLDCVSNIIPYLIKVYNFSFKIDFCLNDLSEQFLLKKGENINRKNNNIIAKNNFMHELFKYQNLLIQEQKNPIIYHGFVFNDSPNNGIILYNNNSFIFPNESFSIAISFNLMVENNANALEENNNNKKYTLFSLWKNEDVIDSNIFIENHTLKMTLFGKIYELFNDVEYNKVYVLWQFLSGNNKKNTSIFYLNEKKIVKHNLLYPKEMYNINIGFDNNKNPYNFVGVLGSFILFNKCFIKEENSSNTQFYEENLLGLKCNYEDVIYISYNVEFSSLNTETQEILKKLSSENIARYIDVVISSKSIMSDDFCCCSHKKRRMYKANYFLDNDNSNSMISFNAENIDINLNNYNFNCQNCLITYPMHISNVFEDFINNNGIKFLELELYYFMAVLDSYSAINNSNNNNNNDVNLTSGGSCEDIDKDFFEQQIEKLKDEEKLLYYKLQYIINLFLYCLKTINKTQEKKISNDIDNFFYTLNNLISIISKNGFKIDLSFLTSIITNLNILIDKNKFFDFCGFILEYESYDPNDDSAFEILFQTILIYLEEYYEKFMSPYIFSKIIDFDKVYLSEKLKDSKKIYSKLIRKCLSLSLLNNEECFKIFIKKIKDLKGINKIESFVRNLYNHITEEEISEEPENYLKSNKYKIASLSDLSISKKYTINFEDKAKKENEEKEETEKLILMYKSLRNLYLCLDKKNKTYNIFITFCLENDGNMVKFFNEEFNYLADKYDIKTINSEINSDNDSISRDSSEGSEDENNNSMEVFRDRRIITEKNKKNLLYSELIKSLCIRFIDEITYKNTMKNLKIELLKEKQNIVSDNNIRHSSTFFKSGSSYNLIGQHRTPSKGQDLFYLNLTQNSSDMLLDNNPFEKILMKNFDFYKDFTISPYTFNSFFLLLFRNLSMETKLKYIKNIGKIFDKLLFSRKSYIDISYFIPIILHNIQRVGEEGCDNIFMPKLEFLEYVYDKFNTLLFDMLEYYNEKKDEVKQLIKNLFCKKDYVITFYLNILDNLKRQKNMIGMIYVFNSKYLSTDEMDKKNNEFIENFLKKVKKNFYDLIDKTLYNLTDPFYFRLLFKIYIKEYKDNKNCDFVLNTIEYIIKKLDEFENSHSNYAKNVNEKLEINNKNLLLLIYKITFFISKRKYLVENNTFIKPIVLYLSAFCNKKYLLYLKIIFPIEDQIDPNQIYDKKLIIEMLFEIFIELYLEFKKYPNQQESFMFEALINDLLISKVSDIDKKNSGPEKVSDRKESDENDNKIKKSKKHSILYMIDELSIKQSNIKLKTFSNNIIMKYLKKMDPSQHTFSVTILFLIKLTIYIKKLEEIDKDCALLDFFIKTSELLCKDAQTLQQKYSTYNPLISRNKNTTELYEEFQNYILKDYIINKTYNKEVLLLKINKNYKISRNYDCVIFAEDGKARLFSINSHIQLISTDGRKNSFHSIEDEDNNKRPSTKNGSTPFGLSESEKERIKNKRNSASSQNLINYGLLSINKKEKIKLINYIIIPKFLNYFVRNHFSLYFLKLLTYDEDFLKVRKIYNYVYHNEISYANSYHLDYPSKLKNRLGNNYVKHFLKKDFNFITSKYFQYSHKCIYNKNFIRKTKYLFPTKETLENYDYAHKDIKINKQSKKFLTRNCELITYKGAVFGDIYIFKNCMIFKSDIENDKRKINDLLDCACCCMEFDFLEEKKTKIIEFSEIKEVISRKFLYSWMSLEVFMKNGKSYLFNFFNEDTNSYILDIFKSNNVFVIKNLKEYFDKKDYIKKWKDGRKSTYDHILLLNKFSSRTYNDSNQYPIMPWIFLHDNKIRNFDIPMSVQDENMKNFFLKMPYDPKTKENRWHSNHYSTSAYICYYLMRTNPFTESMIKFQSNNFDVPDRQFFDLKQTLILCEKNNNNREPIPELYTIPEVYLNLNSNDFGKQTLSIQRGRIHNVYFSPFADDPYEFIYKFKFMLNNDEEINTKINLWFDFIFGINQYNKDNINGQGLRNFNKYCYGQNINIKKIINDMKKKQKPDSKIYAKIKTILGMVISFGQCPFQLLTDEHPKRVYTKGVHNFLLSSADKSKLNKDEQELLMDKNGSNNNISEKVQEGGMVHKLYDNNNKKFNIIYFRKSISKNNLYCILNSKEIEIYQKDSWYREYKYKKKIIVSKNYLLFKKNHYGYPILNPRYLFCELKEEYFIFCRYLDNSIKLVLPNMESHFLLDSFVTSIININEKEFITGDNKGKICHWGINYDDILNIKLQLIKKINSNNNIITAILYNQRLNIVISSDNNSVIIRSFYDFEFLTYFDIHADEKIDNINKGDIIVDIKLSNYDFLYVLINKGNDNYKLKGYSLNGICFGEYEGNITNFELTKEGKVLVGHANMGVVNVLDPIDFKVLFSRFIISSEDENECSFYHFYFEQPNIIFFGFKDKEGSKIRLIVLNKDEIKYFI